MRSVSVNQGDKKMLNIKLTLTGKPNGGTPELFLFSVLKKKLLIFAHFIPHVKKK